MTALALCLAGVTSCRQQTAADVHQRTAITIPQEKVVTVQVRGLKGVHEHVVGLECGPQTWQSFTNDIYNLGIRLKTATNSSEVCRDDAAGAVRHRV